jgi:Lecithin retinol acyltransferase
MNNTFKPGEHLQVRRKLGYNHHGIYISDDRVIQFGSGIFDKPHAAIEAVPLKQFDPGGTAEVVQHGRTRWIDGWLPPADPPHKVIARAEFLLANFPDLSYNLIGNNCEHIANCCASGGWTESHQVRAYFGIRVISSAGIMWYLASLSRNNRPLPERAAIAIVLYVLSGIAGIVIYNHNIRRFWQVVRARWEAHEQFLAQDEPPSEDR